MITRLFVGCAISSAVVGALWLSSTSAAASQTITSPAVGAAATPQLQLASPIEREMLALERHAKVNMILYSGRLGEATTESAPVVALSVTARVR